MHKSTAQYVVYTIGQYVVKKERRKRINTNLEIIDTGLSHHYWKVSVLTKVSDIS